MPDVGRVQLSSITGDFAIALAGCAAFGGATALRAFAPTFRSSHADWSAILGPMQALVATNVLAFPALAILMTLAGSAYSWPNALQRFAGASKAAGILLAGLAPSARPVMSNPCRFRSTATIGCWVAKVISSAQS